MGMFRSQSRLRRKLGPLDASREEEVAMARLVRLDQSGHTELAEWTATDQAAYEQAAGLFHEQLGVGYMGVAKLADDSYEQVKQLPPDVELVILRRPIAGG
jgi:hypothetical protein